MTERAYTTALIVAAGSGVRAAGLAQTICHDRRQAADRPCLHAFADHPAIDRVVVVIAPGAEPLAQAALGAVPLVTGGASRRESVAKGLPRGHRRAGAGA